MLFLSIGVSLTIIVLSVFGAIDSYRIFGNSRSTPPEVVEMLRSQAMSSDNTDSGEIQEFITPGSAVIHFTPTACLLLLPLLLTGSVYIFNRNSIRSRLGLVASLTTAGASVTALIYLIYIISLVDNVA